MFSKIFSGYNKLVRGYCTTSHEHLGDRTSITQKLWQMRRRERERQNVNRQSPTSDHKVITKTPKDSYTEILMPFSNDLTLRSQYISPFGHIRFGRLLEDLDALAGNIAFTHSDDNDPNTIPLTLVTASVDRLDLYQQLDPQKDIRLRGHVSWVGSSSMEIKIDADGKCDAEKWNHLFTSYFTMVARSVEGSKAVQVNRLAPSTPEDTNIFAQGEERKTRRLKARQQSVYNVPPTEQESAERHRLFLQGKNNNVDFVPMSETYRQTTILCQFQERNLHNKLFGGYLMRAGFELAFSTAYVFAGAKPYFQALADISFVKPVSIGSILSLKAQVVYVDTVRNNLQVEVVAEVIKPEERKRDLTNTFSFTFNVPDLTGGPLKPLLPVTYEQSLRYFDGKRKYDCHIQHQEEYRNNISSK
eukprot:TRINITY_DN7606_c0_g1_i1.p1 TRINITY_DN7606_c0_g1~~TRINITY_DN7606_c0_g1_i1.p1  ORF type:complete len:416 (+),score=60.94 TRINITY_DN7606_c0_g1_i1:570-1817(+)